MKCPLFVVAAAILLTGVASAQSVSGADPVRRQSFAHENFERAITEVCVPYILLGDEPRAVVAARFAPGGPLDGLTTYLVGGYSSAAVGVGNRGNGRECTIKPDDSIDSERALEMLRGILAHPPISMAEVGSESQAGQDGRRIAWCSPVSDLAAMVTIGGSVRSRREPVMLVTLVDVDSCGTRCGQPVPSAK